MALTSYQQYIRAILTERAGRTCAQNQSDEYAVQTLNPSFRV